MHLEDFVIGETIHESLRTRVCRAERAADALRVVMKIAKDAHAGDDVRGRFHHERAMMARIASERVARTYGLVDDGRSLALLAEDFGGTSLDRIVAKQPFELPEALRVAALVAAALSDVHASGIVHADLRPHNLVYCRRTSTLKIIDFGMSRGIGDPAPVPTAIDLGSDLAYVSPEQTGRVSHPVDHRSDLYALGVIVYQLLARRLPFDATDPLELVHCHLAKTPVPVEAVDDTIPVVVGDVVARLLHKNPEARYQSAAGLLHDLERCIELVDAGQREVAFPLGARDTPATITIPQRVYGREHEQALLVDAFERARSGGAVLCLVEGDSGIGKSSFVRELQALVASHCGYFIEGKLAEVQRQVPYSGLVSALRSLVQAILGESDARLAEWRVELRAGLGGLAAVLIDAIPELEHVIGKQAAVAVLGPMETQNRFRIALESFVAVVCQPGRPLVIFLDDLQWADAASLTLVDSLVTDASRAHLLVVGACRRDEVDAGHALAKLIARLETRGVGLVRISLGPLGRDELRALCADVFGTTGDDTEALADLLARKTDGNPFFVEQLLRALHGSDVITYDGIAARWRFDLARMEAAGVTDNVGALFARKLQELPESARRLLAIGSCIGASFALEAVALLEGISHAEARDRLEPALRAGLLLSPARSDVGGLYRFPHERVREAARSLLPGAEGQHVHLRLARILLDAARTRGHASPGPASPGPATSASNVCEIVDHLNAGASAITDEADRVTRARLNYEAAQRSKASGSHEAALLYLRAALEATDTWAIDHAFAFAVHKECAELQHLLGDPGAAEALLDRLLEEARTDLERVQIHRQRVWQYTTGGAGLRAIEAGRRALALLGISLPPADGDVLPILREEFRELQSQLGTRDIASLVELPSVTDPTVRAAMQVLDALQPSTYLFAQPLYSYVSIKLVNLSLRHGNAIESVSGYGALFMVFWALEGGGDRASYRKAHAFGELAVRLAERYGSEAQKSRALIRLGACLAGWVEPAFGTLGIFDEGHRAGLASGELQGAGLNLGYRAINAHFLGLPLEQLTTEIKGHLAFANRYGQTIVSAMLEAVLLPIERLRGEEHGGRSESDHEQALARFFESYGSWPAHVACLLVYEAEALLVLGESARALDLVERARARLGDINGLLLHATHAVVSSLALTSRYEALSPAERAAADAALAANQARLAEWAASCPANFGHLHLLVEAERARVRGDRLAAADAYDDAVTRAAASRYLQHEALACELAGRFWRASNKDFVAGPYLRRALRAYRQWGAEQKVSRMLKELGGLLEESVAPKARGASPGTFGGRRGGSFDALTIVKASQAISRQVEFDALIGTLLQLAMENAGAERGAVVIREDAGPVVYASKDLVEGRAAKGAALDDTDAAPASIVQYVMRTGKAVLRGAVTTDPVFGRDPYVLAHAPKSVACVAMVARGTIRGAIYLEHGHLGDAFGDERLHLLETLTSQAAISLDNAALYRTLWAKNVQLESALERVEENVHLKKELEIGARIQTCILPERLSVPGLEIAARMVPASEVGGDYYDVIPVDDGAWVGIGDVAGHGLNAGLVMLMAQTAIATLGRQRQDARPSDLVCAVNELLFENVRHRLRREEHVTLTLLRYWRGGRVLFAGAHEEILVMRASSKRCDRVVTPGTWLGVVGDIREATVDTEIQLNDGDVMVLYTDGVTEAMDGARRQFGLSRLCAIIEGSAGAPVHEIRDRVVAEVERWCPHRADDVTVLVARQRA